MTQILIYKEILLKCLIFFFADASLVVLSTAIVCSGNAYVCLYILFKQFRKTSRMDVNLLGNKQKSLGHLWGCYHHRNGVRCWMYVFKFRNLENFSLLIQYQKLS